MAPAGASSSTGQVAIVDNSGGSISTGSQSLSSVTGTTIDGDAATDELSNEVHYLTDIDGDGNPELVVCNSSYSASGMTNNGAVFVFDSATLAAGGSLTTGNAAQFIEGADDGSSLGTSCATGDTDGDSLDDLIVGAPLHDINTDTDAGLALLLYGSTLFSLSSPTSDTDQTGMVRITGSTALSRLGKSVGFVKLAGGNKEVVLGESLYDVTPTNNEGRAIILENNY